MSYENVNDVTKKIDFAILTTRNSNAKKYENHPRKEEMVSNYYFYSAIKHYLTHFNETNKADYITRNQNARNVFRSLSKEDIYAELLKNIIKMDAFMVRNGYNIALAAKPNFRDCTNYLEKEKWLYRQIMYTSLDEFDSLIHRDPSILNQLIYSYVEDRYFSGYDREAIDDEMNLNRDENSVIFNIDNFYKKKTYNY